MKNFVILSLELIFLILTSLKNLKQSIYSYICYAIVVINLEIVSKEFLSPTNLLEAQTIYIHEIIEVVMICKDQNLILAAFEVIKPYF